MEITNPQKVNDNTLSVDEVYPQRTETKTYDYFSLLERRNTITKQMNDYIAARQKELDEIESLIALADGVGVALPVPPNPVEPAGPLE
jgi:hypothetical protein